MHVTVSSCTYCIIFLVTFAAKGPGFQEMEACSLLVNLRKGMQGSSEQPLVGGKALDNIDLNLVSHRYVSGVLKKITSSFPLARF